MRRHFWIFAGVFLLNPASAPAQEPPTEIGAIAEALRSVRSSIPTTSQVGYEVRTNALAPKAGEFDSAQSAAVRPALTGMDMVRREDVFVCGDRPDSCRLGVDYLVSVMGATGRQGGAAYDVLVEVRESRPQNRRQPVHLKRLLITVDYSAERWTATAQKVISIS